MTTVKSLFYSTIITYTQKSKDSTSKIVDRSSILQSSSSSHHHNHRSALIDTQQPYLINNYHLPCESRQSNVIIGNYNQHYQNPFTFSILNNQSTTMFKIETELSQMSTIELNQQTLFDDQQVTLHLDNRSATSVDLKSQSKQLFTVEYILNCA